MNPNTPHINLYDLAFLGVMFTGTTFALLLAFTQKVNKTANRFLAMAVIVMVCRTTGLLTTEIRIGSYFLQGNYFPLQFSLAFGPLLYFYVLKLTKPDRKLGRISLLHFIPVLLQQVVWITSIKLNPLLQFAEFISVAIYLYLSHIAITHYYHRIEFIHGDRYRYELRWLHRLLTCFGLLWMLWIPVKALDYFYYHIQLGADIPLYLALAVMTIWIAAAAYLRAEPGPAPAMPSLFKLSLPAEFKQKGAWLKKMV
ncbi:MAG: hypothetical protein JST32_13835, partial [Bacteroidetes bacterium]|nr:hypothetical protein [Bacteroidota bacterium]